jgi:predicted transport protein
MNKQRILKRTVEDHLENVPQFVVDLFGSLRKRILEFDNKVQEKARSQYIGYWYVANDQESTLFIEVHIQKRNKRLVLHLRPLDYVSRELIVTQVNDSHKWKLDRVVDVNNKVELEYVIPLVKKSYNDVLNS